MEERSTVLELRNINKSFPGVKALSNMNFNLAKGEVHALVGENGAGKSTLMKIISGAYKKDSGEIFFEGKEIEITSPKQSEMLGISIIYQELNLINRMTVAENVFLGRHPKINGLVNWNKMNREAKSLFDKFGIDMNVKAMLHKISIAQQQIVEIVKAVSINAKVVIMDEPTSSLTSHETEVLFRIIKNLKERGISVVFITHRLDEIYAICDRMTILRDGSFVCSSNVENMTKREMIAAMIGRELTQQFPSRNVEKGKIVFEAHSLVDYERRVKNVSFNVKSGEVVGFAGLVGAGRTETMRLVFGVDKKKEGRTLIDGVEVNIKNPQEAISYGLGFVTENRKEEGLFLKTAVATNIVMVNPKKVMNAGMFLSSKKEKEFALKYVDALRVATPSINQRVMFLSGGNQQKVVLAKWLYADSRILVFDEPTRGIDVGAKREIYEIINDLAAQGKAIIIVSSDMEEIMGVCDRIYVMHEGIISGELQSNDFTQQRITEYAVGGADDDKVS